MLRLDIFCANQSPSLTCAEDRDHWRQSRGLGAVASQERGQSRHPAAKKAQARCPKEERVIGALGRPGGFVRGGGECFSLERLL